MFVRCLSAIDDNDQQSHGAGSLTIPGYFYVCFVDAPADIA